MCLEKDGVTASTDSSLPTDLSRDKTDVTEPAKEEAVKEILAEKDKEATNDNEAAPNTEVKSDDVTSTDDVTNGDHVAADGPEVSPSNDETDHVTDDVGSSEAAAEVVKPDAAAGVEGLLAEESNQSDIVNQSEDSNDSEALTSSSESSVEPPATAAGGGGGDVTEPVDDVTKAASVDDSAEETSNQ